MNIISN